MTMVKFRSTFALPTGSKAELTLTNDEAVLNGAGSVVTQGVKGICSFTFSETVPTDQILDLIIYDSAGVRLGKTMTVWIQRIGVDAVFHASNLKSFAQYMQTLARNLESLRRPTNDTLDIEFSWDVPGDTPGSPNLNGTPAFTSKTKRFKPDLAKVAIVGSVVFSHTDTTSRKHWWLLVRNIADRAADGVNIEPAEIEYAFVDNAGRTGEFTCILYDNASVSTGGASGSMSDVNRGDMTIWRTFVGETTKTVLSPDYTSIDIKIHLENESSGETYELVPTEKLSSSISLTLPSAVTLKPGKWLWSARRSSDDFVLSYGEMPVQRTAWKE